MSHPQFLQAGFDKGMAHLVEEFGEVFEAMGRTLAAIGKTQRFGPDSVNPLLPPAEQKRNIDWLRDELEDAKGAIERLQAAIKSKGAT